MQYSKLILILNGHVKKTKEGKDKRINILYIFKLV